MNMNCNLCKEEEKEENILYKTDNFFIVPTIGPMGIEGYLLICSKEHYMGIGNLPAEQEQELEMFIEKTRQIIAKEYQSEVLVFEHGPRRACHKGGGCLDHAHLHLVPTNADIIGFLSPLFKLEKEKGFERLRRIYEKAESSYVLIEDQMKERYVIETQIPIPSQYLRQIIAKSSGISEWDWRSYPDIETFDKTLKKLKGKF